ncbi:hypothetical protein H4R18_000376 [Coemansia javaensis]|uniref:Ribosomal protein L19 n=1 Tax=Coemansia javaensis TaxID=2761396 RepID=A0A9W8LN48_9FUNG|nr:hypothetical protein H4R18_000376 [Coemansia javaensis]
MLRSIGQRLAGLAGGLRVPGASMQRLQQRAASTGGTEPYIVPQPQFATPLARAEEKRPNVMKVVEREAVARADVDGRAKLFLRRAAPKDRMCAGDVVFVETINSMSDPSATTVFGGVCIAIYRRGIDTSFILRNLVQNVGVEMRFMAYSPLVKRIEIMQKAQRVRRAKLFYLRDRPGRAFQGKALRKVAKSQPPPPAKS